MRRFRSVVGKEPIARPKPAHDGRSPADSPSIQHKPLPPRDLLEVLPPELIGIIFQYWLTYELDLHTWEPTELPLVLCRVSKSWKDFVYGSPFLWRFVSIDASEHRSVNLETLQSRLSRAQKVPLAISLFIRAHPNLSALDILFSSSRQFSELSLKISNSCWWDDACMVPFGSLEKLSVKIWPMAYRLPELSSVFSTAPLLQHLNWSAPADPALLVLAYGHRLRSLDLTVRLDVIQAFDVLAACPNLCSASISLLVETGRISGPKQIDLENLTSLTLLGPGMLIQLLENVRAPLLSTFSLQWRGIEDNILMRALGPFLAHSPLLEDFSMENVIFKEDDLIKILHSHPRISHFSVAALACDRPTGVVTERTFRMLTRTNEEMDVFLPQLEQLVIRQGFRVPDEAILDMIESRCQSIPSESRRSIKLVQLDWCPQVALELRGRLHKVCEKGGVTVKGSFIQENERTLED